MVQERSYAARLFDEWIERAGPHPWLSEAQIRALVCVNERLPNVLEDRGLVFRKLSWVDKVPNGLLMVKVTSSEGSFVCFLRARDMLTAFVLFTRKLGEGSIVWKVDKYP